MPATASPLLTIHTITASSADSFQPVTRAVFYYIRERPPRPAGRYTTAPSNFEKFELTEDQLLKFHQLNTSPPAITVDVVETFRKRLAKD